MHFGRHQRDRGTTKPCDFEFESRFELYPGLD